MNRLVATPHRQTREHRSAASARGRLAVVAAVALGGLLLTACTGTAPSPHPSVGDTVTVLATWTGAELDTFHAVLAPFERSSGIHVEVESTSDLPGELGSRIAAGDPPDISGMVGPGQMEALARSGSLRDLGAAIDVASYSSQTAPAFVELGTVDGVLRGAFGKASLKGLIWYDARYNRLGVPADWNDLQRTAARVATDHTAPWCVGLASGAASGWPGTDWIENILLRQSGPRAYDDWTSGALAWTSPQVRAAFQVYGDVVASGSVAGGPQGAIETPYGDAGAPLFSHPAGCLYLQAASFMPGIFRAQGMRPSTDYDFFPFPDIDAHYHGSVEAAGDLIGMFSDRPAAQALMRYLVSAEAQTIWVSGGGALSANTQVTDYPDAVTRREAQVLTSASRIRFDASDQMPEAVNAAFWKGVLEYTANPLQLDAILADLDRVQATTAGGRS